MREKELLLNNSFASPTQESSPCFPISATPHTPHPTPHTPQLANAKMSPQLNFEQRQMFTIDLTVKNTAFPISVERKLAEDAEAVYQSILTAMRSGSPDIVELKSEGKTEKKVAVRASEISGVQISQRDGATAGGGRPPGFFSLAE